MGVVEVSTLGDGLTICNLRLADLYLCLVLALHALDINFEVELTHALDDGLVGLGIHKRAERRVFLGETVERLAHVVCSLLVHRLDGQ
ncbi:hypothetical protein SDC9_60954 [bioreactor metagenome]|uniref:Uncharacterized protein n=1 Tax=bioreactor metagenome TaxID=1076179 RepID=A0A644XED6_9ZZZZ